MYLLHLLYIIVHKSEAIARKWPPSIVNISRRMYRGTGNCASRYRHIKSSRGFDNSQRRKWLAQSRVMRYARNRTCAARARARGPRLQRLAFRGGWSNGELINPTRSSLIAVQAAIPFTSCCVFRHAASDGTLITRRKTPRPLFARGPALRRRRRVSGAQRQSAVT